MAYPGENLGNYKRLPIGDKVCNEFSTFGNCLYGRERCRFRHVADIPRQEYFIAIIAGTLPPYEGPIKVKRWLKNQEVLQRYFVIKGEWFTMGATEGDLVIFQGSENMTVGRLHYGRVFAVLGRNENLPCEIPVMGVRYNAFTIDPPGCKVRNSALSIENCKEHGGGLCKVIGIHVAAVALINHAKVKECPEYKTNPKFLLRKPFFQCGMDQVYPALSVYFHSHDKSIKGPTFTPVGVRENYSFDDQAQYKPLMDILWPCFVGESAVQKITQTGAFGYLMQNPRTWKEFLLTDVLMNEFTSCVSKYIAGVNGHHFITKTLPETPLLVERQTVVLFENYYTNAKLSIETGDCVSNEDLLILIAAGKKYQRPTEAEADYLASKYEVDVELSSKLAEKSVVKCTSPYRNVHHFLNQQILMRCMIKSSEKMYSREELLGNLGLRFRTPALRKSFVKSMRKSTFLLECAAKTGIDQSIHEASFRLLHDTEEVLGGIMKIYFKNIVCRGEDFCNRKMISLDWKAFEEFVRELHLQPGDKYGESGGFQTAFQVMSETKAGIEPTYQKHGNDTVLKLQENIELQLQISEQDGYEKNELEFRLLRIGRNCHFCITHVNYPELAFMSDRKDIRQLVTSKRIAAMKEVSTDQKLESSRVTVTEVLIKWDDEYYSGGSFATELKMELGDLLCARKEIMVDADEVDYVWVCHGVVSEVTPGLVKFSVCTLSQAEKDPDERGFRVEIIGPLD